uniref:Uncharacterized protein n=1 Tax=Heterorhabditis bacteriophora TaxID=37862 RepID=A0A1I7XKW3_HETBA
MLILRERCHFSLSPRKFCQPIEIIVRHNKVVEQPASSDSDDDDCTRNEKRLSVVHEGLESSPTSAQQPCSSKSLALGRNGRGHRRTWSMPNAKGEMMTLAVIQDNETLLAIFRFFLLYFIKHCDWIIVNFLLFEEDGNTYRRRIVRYRLHPLKYTDWSGLDGGDAGRECKIRFDVNAIPHPDEDDNELEVEINEEGMVVPGESGKGARTIVKRDTAPLCLHLVAALKVFLHYTQKQEIYGPICMVREIIEYFILVNILEFMKLLYLYNIISFYLGCVAFLGIGLWFLTRPVDQVQFMEKIIFSAFFLGAVTCLGMSFVFHTVACHSVAIGKLFSKLDYTGITLLIVGSFVPWIYYAFYCRPQPMIIYITMISVLGVAAMIVSLWDKFAEPKFRPVRAGVFVAMGLSAIVPAAHLLFVDGVDYMINKASLGWMLLMGGMYIGGAAIYATRIPERCFPGKCDLWFQSHQLFHCFVVAAAFVHFHAITEMGMKKLMEGSCAEQLLDRVDYAPNECHNMVHQRLWCSSDGFVIIYD